MRVELCKVLVTRLPDQRLNLFAADRAAVRVLGVVVLAFPVMMAVSGAKEPPIAVQAAIRILKQHMVKEPILEAAPSRSKELFAPAIGTPRGSNVRSGFVHGKILCRERPLGGRGLKSCER